MALWETLHGHLGVLAAAALLHPAILLRRGKAMSRGARYAVFLTSVLVALAFASGLFIYPAYRQAVRAALFLESPTAGFLFETKEHIAYGVLAMTAGATTAAFLAPSDKGADPIRRAAALVYAAGAALCLATVALGSYVASVQGFR
jgi:hypothetical protein